MKRNIRKLVTLVLSLVMIMGCFIYSADAASYSLDLTALADLEYYEDVTAGQFTLRGTSEKHITVETLGSEEVASDGITITKMLKFNGASNGGEYRRIEFTLTEKSSLKIYTRSNGSERALGIWDLASTAVDETSGYPVPILTTPAPDKGSPIVLWEVELEPGSYYIASTSGGVNVYGLIVTSATPEPTPEPTTAPTAAPTTAPTTAPTQTPDIPKDGESNMIYAAMFVCAAAAFGCVYFTKKKRA